MTEPPIDAPLQGLYEAVLYATDVPAVAEFYRSVLGMAETGTREDWFAAFCLPDGGVLLVFDPELSSVPGRNVPSHGATGEGHIAFSVAGSRLDVWRDRFTALGIEIEREITWPTGAVSIYVRDPAGNSVELVDGEIWR